jgi:type VI secretion system secreted protein VgrG
VEKSEAEMSEGRVDETIDVRIEANDFPCGELRVRRLAGREVISSLFDFELEVVSLAREGVDVTQMMGASVAIVIQQHGAEVRRIHGMIVEVDDFLASHAEFRPYRVRIAPRAHRLTLVETQDIFMNVSVPEIIKSKLALLDLGDADVEMRLTGVYPPREFVVQYKESDLAFVSRLAEHLGISFFFEHRDGKDVMVFTDHAAGFRRIDGGEAVLFRGGGDERFVHQLVIERRLVPRFFAVRDYNYRTPLVGLAAEHALEDGYAGGVIEHGGHFKTQDEGKALAIVRAEERQASQLVYAGKSEVARFIAGSRVRLEGHPDLAPTDLLIVEVEHEASITVAGSGVQAARTYQNRFRAIPADRTYRPRRTTPRPKIAGLVTGIIDGGQNSGSSTAQIDEQGRYLVRFLFDSTPRTGQAPSRRIRMAQEHVGENYGSHFPLRPDTEVVIGFIDGDPDRPVIVGAVSNPIKPSPVDVRNPTVHRVRTASGITVDIQDGK